jgi:hypothetical protein
MRKILLVALLSSSVAFAQDNQPPPYEATQPGPAPGGYNNSQPPAPSQGVPNGVLVQLGLGVAFVQPLQVLPSITVGYRLIDRLELRLSAQFSYGGVAAGLGGGNTWSVAAAPGLAIDIARLLHRRVALTGVISLPLGATGQTGGGPSPNLFLVGFTAGLGARFAIVPAFAVGFDGGIIGLFQVNTGAGGGSVDTVGFYGQLSGTVYFGAR